MSDEKSTPISSLNNKPDESDTVNQILSKYNTLQENNNNTIPSQDKNIPEMEQKFESRDLNKEAYDLKADNTQYQQHAQSENQRLQQLNTQEQKYENNIRDDEDYDDDESYEEYEMEELPLWKKITNEIRVPLFIFLSILAVMSTYSNKMLISKVPFFGNEYNELNTKGFLVKAFICSLIAYILVRFIRV
tara:strand:- start:44 stop:613 length:570 start_codon:yes stop_codon:yes gene_type:complete